MGALQNRSTAWRISAAMNLIGRTVAIRCFLSQAATKWGAGADAVPIVLIGRDDISHLHTSRCRCGPCPYRFRRLSCCNQRLLYLG